MLSANHPYLAERVLTNHVLKCFEDQWAPNLSHRFDLLAGMCKFINRGLLPFCPEQGEAGLYTLKRAAAFMKKIAVLIKTACVEGIKDAEHELDKKSRIQRDM